jgi:S1-C subfamily serine protease
VDLRRRHGSTKRGEYVNFFVGSDGYILTCALVLPSRGGALSAIVSDAKIQKKEILTAQIVARDDSEDLALLKVPLGFSATCVRLEIGNKTAFYCGRMNLRIS